MLVALAIGVDKMANLWQQLFDQHGLIQTQAVLGLLRKNDEQGQSGKITLLCHCMEKSQIYQQYLSFDFWGYNRDRPKVLPVWRLILLMLILLNIILLITSPESGFRHHNAWKYDSLEVSFRG